MPVVPVEHGGEGIPAQLVDGVGRGEEQGVEAEGGEQGQQGGHEAADAMAPEAEQLDGALPPELGQQQAGDQEPREDEEHVNAEEAAAHPRQAAVEQEDEHDPEGAHAIEGWDGGHRRLRMVLAEGCLDHLWWTVRHRSIVSPAPGRAPGAQRAADLARQRISGFSIRNQLSVAMPKMIERRSAWAGQNDQCSMLGMVARYTGKCSRYTV